jgi:hypothetical protein
MCGNPGAYLTKSAPHHRPLTGHGSRPARASRPVSGPVMRQEPSCKVDSLYRLVLRPRDPTTVLYFLERKLRLVNSRRLEARTCLCTSECPRVRRELASLAHFAVGAAGPTAFLCNEAPETRTHHADNSSVLVSHPRDHNCSAVVIPNMPGQLHSGASIRVPCDPFLHDHGRLLRLLLGIEWTVPRVHVWHDMLEHPNLLPR